MARANVTPSSSAVSFVQVQTLHNTTGGTVAALATVEAAVKAYNAQAPKGATPHAVAHIPVLANNTKGMQWQLALLATLARANGATMVRLSVHNGQVALCGTPAALKATQAAMVPATNTYATAVAAAYNPAQHGNRVGFSNGYLCGCPAGLSAGLGITATLAYGIGYLFTFPAPSNAAAYALGHAAGVASAKDGKPAPKAGKLSPKALAATTDEPTATDELTATDEPTTTEVAA